MSITPQRARDPTGSDADPEAIPEDLHKKIRRCLSPADLVAAEAEAERLLILGKSAGPVRYARNLAYLHEHYDGKWEDLERIRRLENFRRKVTIVKCLIGLTITALPLVTKFVS